MPTTALPPTALADLERVTESLQMISPRWSVWVLMTLSDKPLRYAEIKSRLPWLHDGTLHPRIRQLTEAGLVDRTAYNLRHVTYALTDRGADLMPVLKVIATWGDTYLAKDTVLNPATGKREPERITPAQNIEDTLLLLTPRHTTAILWTLRMRGRSSTAALDKVVMPERTLNAVYPPLRRLIRDGLVERGGEDSLQLSATGQALAPAYRALSAWAAGRPLSQAGSHPVWGEPTAPSQTGPGAWAAVPTAQAGKPMGLLSDQVPDLLALSSLAGGQRR